LLFFAKGCSEFSNEILTSDPNSHAYNLLQKITRILGTVLLNHFYKEDPLIKKLE
jgi:hypothetical protein